ncbi:unnamed protein product [Adineta ricciae]|uniref:Uncharacterized protein n=1 Tax=Adineta ricciae TaxID=249248 RepID=A0A813Q2X7_ADIRI|nr:unnamed protein product [Adineta ricciae]
MQLTKILLIKLLSFQNSAYPAGIGNIIPSDGSAITRSSDKRRKIFFICEPIFSAFAIFPLIIIFWEAGWNFIIDWLDTSVGQHRVTVPLLYVFSQLILLAIYTTQDHLYGFLAGLKNDFLRVVLLQFHCLISALSYIIQWVSMWTLWDYYTSDEWLPMLLISFAAILAIIILVGHPCDLVCAPFVISYDSVEYNIRIGTPFTIGQMNRYVAHLLNYIFYEYLTSILCILAWRGSYKFLDIHLYPENEIISGIFSLLSGYLLYFTLMYTQVLQNNTAYSTPFLDINFPLFLENLRHICSFFSCVLLWRGFWIVFDEFIVAVSLINGNRFKFYIIAMIISFLILSFMKTASSIHGPMSHIDDEYELFPIYRNCFLSKWFEKKNSSLNEMKSNSRKTTTSDLYTITIF